MMERFKRAWARHPVLTGVFLAAVVLMAVFAVRSTLFVIYWSDPAHHEQPIEGWMTPRYIMHSWKVPPEVVLDAIGRPAMPGKRQNLDEIAEQQGISTEELIDRVTRAVEASGPERK